MDPAITLLFVVLLAIPAVIVVLGVRRERRRSRAPGWELRTGTVLGQPVLLTDSSFAARPGAQDRMLLEQFRPGTEVEVLLPTGVLPPGASTESSAPATARLTARLTVGAVKRSLRGGWPTANLGYGIYFAEYDGSELPTAVPVLRHRSLTSLRFDLDGLGIVGADNREQAVPWAQVDFSNGPDLKVRIPGYGVLTFEERHLGASYRVTEELLIKYGTFRQLHF
ncbi:MAG: hypothetical protein J7518_20795 [Nocardioidaceae bacterium]|nr:hypothetical protein [Nocardioidaceae bacterium]